MVRAVRLGWKGRQVRPIVEADNPEGPGTFARDEDVAFLRRLERGDEHLSPCVAVIIAGRLGRGSSTSVSSHPAHNRLRHFRTAAVDTPCSRPTNRGGRQHTPNSQIVSQEDECDGNRNLTEARPAR